MIAGLLIGGEYLLTILYFFHTASLSMFLVTFYIKQFICYNPFNIFLEYFIIVTLLLTLTLRLFAMFMHKLSFSFCLTSLWIFHYVNCYEY